MKTGTRVEVTRGYRFNNGSLGNSFEVQPGEWGTVRGVSGDGGLFVQWDSHPLKPNSYIFPEQFDSIRAENGKGIRPTHAHVSLCRLGGCNYKVPVTYRGKSVYLNDPPECGRTYRISAAKFLAGYEAGDRQSRDTWSIRPWDDHAERTTESEKNWQT